MNRVHDVKRTDLDIIFATRLVVETTISWVRVDAATCDQANHYREVVEYEGRNVATLLEDIRKDIFDTGPECLSSRFYYSGGFPFDDDVKLAAFNQTTWERAQIAVMRGETFLWNRHYWLSAIPDA